VTARSRTPSPIDDTEATTQAIMAPPSNSPKAMQHSRSRPSVPKAIVPAIPLPYIQKRKQQVAAREKAKEDAQPGPVVEPQSSPTTTSTVVEPAVANGSSAEHEKSMHGEASKEASNTSEQVLPVVSSNGEESRETASQEPAAPSHQKTPGKLRALHF
jgi:hypothetical protein